jgi:uncharacterized membrane protein
VIDLIATIVAIAGLVAGAGGAAFLGMMQSAARKRGAAGAPVAADVRKRWPAVGIALALSLVALLLTAGGTGADIFAIILGAAGIGAGANALTAARKKYQI